LNQWWRCSRRSRGVLSDIDALCFGKEQRIVEIDRLVKTPTLCTASNSFGELVLSCSKLGESRCFETTKEFSLYMLLSGVKELENVITPK